MFRKQDDRLWRLNQELLAEEDCEDEYKEDCEDEFEEEYEDEFEEDEDFDEEYDEDEKLLSGSGYARSYRRGSPKEFDYLPEEDDFDDGDFLDRKAHRRANRKNRGKNLGWAIIALLEVLAIAAIALWWASWVL